MELKAGYKQTEIGVIPSEWTVRPVRDVCKLINGRGFKPYEWKTTGLPIIRIQNLNGSDDFNYFSGTYDKKLEVDSGQLLFAWSGSRGSSFGPHIWRGPLGVLNYHTWKVQIRETETNKSFLAHLFRQLTSTIEEKAHGASALVHTQKWEMEGYLLPIPTKPEQELIAQALSDADALIESLDQLIAKKRQIKQGAMQELLTGKRRLPGFGGGWSIITMKDVLTMPATYGIVTAGAFVQNGIKMLRGGDIFDGSINNELPMVSLEKSAEYRRTILTKNDVVIALVGYPGASAKIPDELIGSNISRAVGLLRLNAKVSPDYLVCMLNSPGGRRMVLAPSAGSAQQVVNLAALNKLQFSIPVREEQEAIASIFSEMDTEIAALESRLTKARQIKQGMMQELLTGRIRLL